MNVPTAPLEVVKEFRPLMNADKHGLKTKILSASIGVHLRLETILFQLLTVAAPMRFQSRAQRAPRKGAVAGD
jgi:hypothetical protein